MITPSTLVSLSAPNTESFRINRSPPGRLVGVNVNRETRDHQCFVRVPGILTENPQPFEQRFAEASRGADRKLLIDNGLVKHEGSLMR